MAEGAIIARVLASPLEVDATAWNALLALQSHPTPFMRHEYLAALHESESAVPHTGWTPRFMTLWEGDLLVAACPLYLKSHSYGEYVFDWAWASAYEQHGVPYYPKAVVAVPFTPVPGTRLMARDAAARQGLVQALCQWCEDEGISSLHVLFASDDDVLTGAREGLMLRHTVQFHWKNVAPTLGTDVSSLPPEGALAALGRPGGGSGAAPTLGTDVSSLPPEGALAALGRPGGGSGAAPTLGTDVSSLPPEGALAALGRPGGVYRCYERTYLEHGNAPYLTRDFFRRMADDLPQTWLLFVAERAGRPIASSLIALHVPSTLGTTQKSSENVPQPASPGLDAPLSAETVAYGRYWGALERVDCLHFEACYYQPLQWCIEHGVHRFEGGAQGEHKMARALLPVRTSSAHWLAHPDFAEAVERFLEREGQGVGEYLEHLEARSPLRKPPGA
jgi:predicted N-acyltransferase